MHSICPVVFFTQPSAKKPQKMLSLSTEFEDIKYSALSKLKLISPYIKESTLGPSSNNYIPKQEHESCTSHKTIQTPNDNDFQSWISDDDDSIPLGKLYAESEELRRNEVQSAVQVRLRKMEAAMQQQDLEFKLKWLQKQREISENTRRVEEVMLHILKEQELEAKIQQKELQDQYQRQIEEHNKIQKEIQDKRVERRRKQEEKEIFDAMQIREQKYRHIFNEVVTAFGNSRKQGVNTSTVANDVVKMNTLAANMESLLKKSSFVQADVDQAESLLPQMIEEKNRIISEIDLLIRKKYEHERQKQEASLKQSSPSAPLPPKKEPSVKLDNFCSLSSLKLYVELQKFLEMYQSSYQALVNDDRLQQFKFDCKKAVNIPLNAISAVSVQHMLDKYKRLHNLLAGKPVVVVGNRQISAAQHPQGVAFCTDLLAKKFVVQGDLMVSSNPESAFCYASMIVSLWMNFPDFGRLILAHFYQQCPYLIPMYPPKSVDQTDEDFYKSLGYNYVDGVVEKQDKFLKRMSGIARLYAAILITKPRKGQPGPHPHGLCKAWKWFSCILNLEPRMDITATIILDFLEVTGNSMLSAYGKQFEKLLKYLFTEYTELMKKVDSGGPVTRLEVFFQKYQKLKRIEPPKGKLSDGFW